LGVLLFNTEFLLLWPSDEQFHRILVSKRKECPIFRSVKSSRDGRCSQRIVKLQAFLHIAASDPVCGSVIYNSNAFMTMLLPTEMENVII